MTSAFPRASRLTNRREFDYVFSAPEQRSSDRYFTVLGRFREQGAAPRLGLVVAKKRIARAHERNRVKRLIRESFRLAGKEALNCDVVVMPKTAAQEADNQALAASLAKHWQRQAKPAAQQS